MGQEFGEADLLPGSAARCPSGQRGLMSLLNTVYTCVLHDASVAVTTLLGGGGLPFGLLTRRTQERFAEKQAQR